ncbi:sucrose phosphorylase [Actinotalea sp. C106]|uniref:sucrose phosphorylase n=1 Tax=Actinotalea sp. C106 TaxID=2908644 RepID=UPI0020287E6F|nr:sucrose phosphorylase [Actinotalea sp. C106]
MRNQVQLITYADRLGGDLPGLSALLRERFEGVFGGVHVLPFFTPYDGADAGFDPEDHTAVDPRLGSWQDVRALGDGLDTVVDVIVNHVSAGSAQVRDVVSRGSASPWAGMFLTLASVFPDGATEQELATIYRPRPGLPFTPMTWGGERRLVWTTFTPQQVDLDVSSREAREYLVGILDTLAAAEVSMIRLDAVGYAVKTPGTTCFMTPETFAVIDELTLLARERGLEVLVEVHSYYQRQVEIGRAVDRVYDFALPPLVLHAAYTGDHGALLHWMGIRPTNAVTVLDTHDGIGIVDVGPDQTAPDRPGLLDPAQLDAVVEGIHAATGGASRRATGWAASNLDVYQVNSTFYDALARDDHRYLAARALQLFTPGIPQVYYVGALAGHNDLDLLESTGVGRDINRHHYTVEEVEAALERPVVRALCALARFRNTLDVFDGRCEVTPVPDGGIAISWQDGDRQASVVVDLASGRTELTWSDGAGRSGRTTDLLVDPPVA